MRPPRWDHEFASGGGDLPSYIVEVDMPKVPAFFVHAGVKLNSIALEFTRSGPAAATVSAIAQGETRFGTTQGGTPTSLTFSRISQFQGSIKRASSPVGNLTGGLLTYSNNLKKIETIRDDGLIEGADPTIAALTGRIDVRFADTTLLKAPIATRSTASITKCARSPAGFLGQAASTTSAHKIVRILAFCLLIARVILRERL